MDPKLATGKTREGLRLLSAESTTQFVAELRGKVEAAYQDGVLSNERLADCATSTFNQILQRPGTIFFRNYTSADPPRHEAVWVYGEGAHNRMLTHTRPKDTSPSSRRLDVLFALSSSMHFDSNNFSIFNKTLFTLFSFHCIRRYIEHFDSDFKDFLDAIRHIVIISPILYSEISPLRSKTLPIAIPIQDGLLLGFNYPSQISLFYANTLGLNNDKSMEQLDVGTGIFRTTLHKRMMRKEQHYICDAIADNFAEYLMDLVLFGMALIINKDDTKIHVNTIDNIKKFLVRTLRYCRAMSTKSIL